MPDRIVKCELVQTNCLYVEEIDRLTKEKHYFFDSAIELGKRIEDLNLENEALKKQLETLQSHIDYVESANEKLGKQAEYLNSSSLLAQEVSMKEEWRNKAVQHAEEVLELQSLLREARSIIAEALKTDFMHLSWDNRAKSFLYKLGRGE